MEIECKFTAISRQYSCEVTKAAITKPNVDIVSFEGKHQPGKSNDDVTRVNFYYGRVEYFPRNLQKFFPRLKTLEICNLGLREITREDLIGLENLAWLNLSGNQLKSLPGDLFSNMPNMKRVWLSCNKIEFASSKLIEPIVKNQLKCFYLDDNKSIGEYYSPACRTGTGCKTIQELMAKIDEKCKPPTTQIVVKPPAPQIIVNVKSTKLQNIVTTPATQMIVKPTAPQSISKTAHRGSNGYDTAGEIFKGFNEHRLSGRFTDFVIVVGSKEFPVHKSVLATQSLILAEMFEVKTNGRSASKLEISDLSAEAVKAFLDFLYERKLPDAQNAMEIFKLAAKYEVAKLKIICEGIIQDNIDESNAFEIFKLACGSQKSEKLKVAAFGKLQEKFGVELDDDLMNHPEKLQEIFEAFLGIVEAKKVFDNLMNKTNVKKQRLV